MHGSGGKVSSAHRNEAFCTRLLLPFGDSLPDTSKRTRRLEGKIHDGRVWGRGGAWGDGALLEIPSL